MNLDKIKDQIRKLLNKLEKHQGISLQKKILFLDFLMKRYKI